MTLQNRYDILYLSERNKKGDFKMNNNYYWMHKEDGYLVTENELYNDACDREYDDITDPTSVEYLNFNLYYTKTNMKVQ